MSIDALQEIEAGKQFRKQNESNQIDQLSISTKAPVISLQGSPDQSDKSRHISSLPSSLAAHFSALTEGLVNLSTIPTLVIGVQSDALFPYVQQREIAEALRQNGNKTVVYYELDSPMGHDSFLLDVANVTAALKGFL